MHWNSALLDPIKSVFENCRQECNKTSLTHLTEQPQIHSWAASTGKDSHQTVKRKPQSCDSVAMRKDKLVVNKRNLDANINFTTIRRHKTYPKPSNDAVEKRIFRFIYELDESWTKISVSCMIWLKWLRFLGRNLKKLKHWILILRPTNCDGMIERSGLHIRKKDSKALSLETRLSRLNFREL